MVPKVIVRPPRTKIFLCPGSTHTKYSQTVFIYSYCSGETSNTNETEHDMETPNYGLLQEILHECYGNSLIYDHLQPHHSLRTIALRLAQLIPPLGFTHDHLIARHESLDNATTHSIAINTPQQSIVKDTLAPRSHEISKSMNNLNDAAITSTISTTTDSSDNDKLTSKSQTTLQSSPRLNRQSRFLAFSRNRPHYISVWTTLTSTTTRTISSSQ